MNVVYNSDWYHVIEYPGGGLEVIAKAVHRGGWLSGAAADSLRARLAEAAASGGSVEHLDAALAGFDALLQQPTYVH